MKTILENDLCPLPENHTLFFSDYQAINFSIWGITHQEYNQSIFKWFPCVMLTHHHVCCAHLCMVCKSGNLHQNFHTYSKKALVQSLTHYDAPNTAGTRHRHSGDMDFTHKKRSIGYNATRYVAHFEVPCIIAYVVIAFLSAPTTTFILIPVGPIFVIQTIQFVYWINIPKELEVDYLRCS